jgi:phosphoribosylformylglycinamidine cyclo-ligase
MLTATLDVRAMAHVTGGGLLGNLGRPLPKGLGVRIDLSSWERPAVFTWLASLGVDEEEMRRVFNLGLGYAAIVAQDDVELALKTLERSGERAWLAGEVIEGGGVTVA